MLFLPAPCRDSIGASGNLTAASGWQLLSYWTLGYGKPLRAHCSVKILRYVKGRYSLGQHPGF